MDPVTALSVAAAAAQFTQIAIKLTKRITVFMSKDAEGPIAFIESLRNQLHLLDYTCRRIKEGLTVYQDKFQADELTTLGECLSSLGRDGEKLDKLLNSYLPSDKASTPAKLLAVLKSIAADIEIKSVIDRIKELHGVLERFIIAWVAFKDGVAFDLQTERSRQRSRLDTIYQVSRHEVLHFVDRPLILDEIDRLFGDADIHQPRIAILQGMGGQGKTQLALRYCANSRLRNIYDCIFWIDASTRASTLRGLEDISEELNDNGQALPDSEARIAFVRRKLAADSLKWLLVFDNYDDPAAFDLRDYIPSGLCGNTLITSRSTDTRRIGPIVHISGMTEGEAIQLLFKQLDIPDDGKNQVAAAEIVRRLGYLPLAIDQAGAYMKAECLPLTDFISHYEQSAREVLQSVPSLWEYNDPATREAKTVSTTWNLSFTLLKPNTPTGALKVTVLSLLAFFDEHEISEELFETYYSADVRNQQLEWMSLFTDGQQQWSSRKFDSIMREFLQLSLITSHDRDGKETGKYAFVSLHPLVRDWINLRQDVDTYRKNFTTFTRILAASLSSKFWEDSHFDFGFRMSESESRRLERHVIPWIREFKTHKPNLCPTIVIPERDTGYAAITAEQLLAEFLDDMGEHESSCEVLRWLWEYYGTSDDLELRIKFGAGYQEIFSLCNMYEYEQAVVKSREKYQFWRSVLGVDGSADDMLHISFMVLIYPLSLTVSLEDKREVVDLCQCELERIPNDVRNLSRRHHILVEVLTAADILNQNDIRDSTLNVILCEAVAHGGNDYGKGIWSNSNWYNVTQLAIRLSDDLHTIEQLTEAAVKWVMYKYGPNHTEVVYFDIIRAKYLRRAGKLVEAEVMARDCISKAACMWHADSLYGRAYEVLGNILEDQKRYEEAYEARNSVLLATRGPNLEWNRIRLLHLCGRVALRFNVSLAHTHLTMRLQLSKNTGHWDVIIYDIMWLSYAKAKLGTDKATQEALDVLIEGLEVYGLEIVHRRGNTPRKYLREIDATINLEDSNSAQSLAEDESVRGSLMRKFHGYYGFDLLIRVARQLLQTSNTKAAEQIYQLARNTFDNAMDMEECIVTDFLKSVFRYTKLHYRFDGDKKIIQDTLEWAKHTVCGKCENGMNGLEDWWDEATIDLMELIGPEVGRKHRVIWKPIQRLSDRFSRAVSFNSSGLSSSSSELSIQHGLGSAHSVATSLAGPASARLRGRSILRKT
ncbi:hypothetical protein F4821DRAFT_40840 [Hypoxylon rubiginosum]|uniref:Uncharacterized protein n=1 Tax=Hypoxylon rubiginosum TaxID=110542 RepID=A0ACC0CKT8_9PEZI|nr:hypothetical protein F4821DRAFT_40840 [Hypoxylon rubiginosum]